MSQVNKLKKPLSSVFKLAAGLILGTLIMKFVLGFDAKPLINVLSADKSVGFSAVLQALILLIQTLISLPLCVGFGILLIEILDLMTFRKVSQK